MGGKEIKIVNVTYFPNNFIIKKNSNIYRGRKQTIVNLR